MKSLSYFIQVAAFLLFLTAAAFCQPAQQPHETCGKPANGIALCLSPSEERNGIILEIKNTGPKDALLNLGIMLDTGQKQYPNAIQLLVVDSEGKQHYAELAEPTWIGGRVDPFILPLPDSASFKLPLHLSKYFYFTAGHVIEEFKPDPMKHYIVQARFTEIVLRKDQADFNIGMIPITSFWTGSVNSNSVEVGPK